MTPTMYEGRRSLCPGKEIMRSGHTVVHYRKPSSIDRRPLYLPGDRSASEQNPGRPGKIA